MSELAIKRYFIRHRWGDMTDRIEVRNGCVGFSTFAPVRTLPWLRAQEVLEEFGCTWTEIREGKRWPDG